jgi:quercetin dioxygenase-like cupin family protein
MNTTTQPVAVRAAELGAYSPAHHSGTSNVRVIGPETVGATAIEVLIGTIVPSHGARPHAHPQLEQCAYMIEGSGESQADGRSEAMARGSWSYVPAGAFHSFRVTSAHPGRVLVVYTPPYGENPAQTITDADPAVQPRGSVKVLPADVVSAARGVLIDRETAGAQWVEIEAVHVADTDARPCAARPDAEQVLYVEQGRVLAKGDGLDFDLAPGDFLFLPPRAGVALSCPPGRRASGFLIKGRLPSLPSA